MNQIKFTHNWNKKLTKKYFTTIRKSTTEKLRYYAQRKQQVFDILLRNKKIGKARLLDVECHILEEIPYGLLLLDTGIKSMDSILELFNKFGVKEKDMCLILTFEKYV